MGREFLRLICVSLLASLLLIFSIVLAQNPGHPANRIGGTTDAERTFASTGRYTFLGDLVVGGNVGIGTSSPTSKLHVIGDITSSAYVRAGQGLCIGSSCITSFPQPPPTYWTASGNNIYNTNAGNVGIGTSSPTSKLHVIGDITSSAYVRAGQGLCIGTSCITSFPQPSPTYWTASGNNIYNTNTGNVGIGTTNPGYKLEVVGSVGADSYFYRSDISLKTNITKINEEILDKIMKLEPVRFKWKNSDEESVGLIAQEVEKIFPELVYTTPNGTKSIDYGKLTVYLIKAIKEMNEKCK